MRFRVTGADATTGQTRTVEVEADTEVEALKGAKAHGVFASEDVETLSLCTRCHDAVGWVTGVAEPTKCSSCKRELARALSDPLSNRRSRTSRTYDGDDERISRRSSRDDRRPRYRCPYCGTDRPPVWRSYVSPVGWGILVVLLLFFCLPLCWIGLLIREHHQLCPDCSTRLS